MIRTCIGSGCFTRPTGDLGLQLTRRTDHVEAMAPPYVVALSVARLEAYGEGGGPGEGSGSGGGAGTTAVAGDVADGAPKRSVAVSTTSNVDPASVAAIV